MIIDFHCHAGTGEAMTAPWTTTAPLGRYLRRARRCGITQTVVMPTFNRDSRRANRELARIVRSHPRRLVGFAWVDPLRDEGHVEELVDEAVHRLGLVGLKVHGERALPTREVCTAAQRFGLPVIVDLHGRAHAAGLFASQYPSVRFVLAHLGSFADDWRAHEAVIDLLTRHRNLWADTSGVRRFDYLVEAMRRAGPLKLVFGSDGPWLHPAVELRKIELLGLSPAAFKAVVAGNAGELLSREAQLGLSWRARAVARRRVEGRRMHGAPGGRRRGVV
jgi:uncharacterized protein